MMVGYDKSDAIRWLMAHVDRKEHKSLIFQLESLLSEIIDADMAYMHNTGVLDDEGYAGDAYYDDDEALEFILETLVTAHAYAHAYAPDEELRVGALIGDYIDLQQAYLESAGLVDYD